MTNEDGLAEFDTEIAALLADPSMWAEPSADLEDRVVASVAAERRNKPSASIVPSPRRSRQWPGRVVAAVLGAAAAITLVTIATTNDSKKFDARVVLAGTKLASGIVGRAEVTAVTSGVRVEFSVPGLPRRDGTEFYEAWLKNCEGTALVPIGTYHDLENATGWAGVALDDFAVLTVTREVVAGPKDPAQGTSGEVVVSGPLRSCP
jgi:hypothetical protein